MRTFVDIEAESERLDAEKPYVELIDGIEVRKVSPGNRHGYLQTEFGILLKPWARSRGRVGTEIRFWLVSERDRPTSLVPDVAFISNARIDALDEASRQRMPFAPDLAVEIRSPFDRPRNVARKIALYLRFGSRLVLDIDPKDSTIVAHDARGARAYTRDQRFEHAELPGFAFEIEAFFQEGE
ncbi:MAG: Uma2 family endonuclease [Vulcanimicrobiaceae bacterium]